MDEELKQRLKLIFLGLAILAIGYVWFHAWIWQGSYDPSNWGKDMGCRMFGTMIMLTGGGMIVSGIFLRVSSAAP